MPLLLPLRTHTFSDPRNQTAAHHPHPPAPGLPRSTGVSRSCRQRCCPGSAVPLQDSERPAPCRAGETEAKCEFPAPSPREFFAVLTDHGCHRQHHTLGPAAGHPVAQQSRRASCQLLFEGPGGDRDTFQRFRKRQLPGPQGRGSETTSANPR